MEGETKEKIVSRVSHNIPPENSTVDCGVTDFLAMYNSKEHFEKGLKIDRMQPMCLTPRRNPQVECVLSLLHDLNRFYKTFTNVFSIWKNHSQIVNVDLVSPERTLLHPILPVFNNDENASKLLTPFDMISLLSDQKKTLRVKLNKLNAQQTEGLMTTMEIRLCFLWPMLLKFVTKQPHQ